VTMNGTLRRNRRATMLAAASFAMASCALASCAYFTEAPESRAIVVGIDNYPNINSLEWCVADAKAMVEALDAEGTTLIDGSVGSSPVVKQTVTDALESAAAEAPTGGYDRFLFYYSGHGDPVFGGSILMADVTPSLSAGAAISTDELLSLIAKIPARTRVAILDSCYSGAFVREEPAYSPVPDDYEEGSAWTDSLSLPRFLASAASAFSAGAGGGIIALSAAGADELSWEIDGDAAEDGHGVFTSGLLEAKTSGDLNLDGLVTAAEAYDYAVDYVEKAFNATAADVYKYLPRVSGTALDAVLFVR
ncbi:MAG TPA: hypothetical protein DIC34_05370, partial [Treponema sp.]|nr:hypothetical protein [Treponema sp.]